VAAIGIALILLTIAGPHLKDGAVWVWNGLKARLPSAGGIGGILTAKVELPIWKAALLVVAFWMISAGGGGISLPTLPKIPGWPDWLHLPSITTKATAATYVYEKDQGGIPAAVMSGINRLNTERKILATEFERDTKNGNQEIPAQYKIAVDAAKELPSLVATSGARVLKVTKDPRTEEAVIGGVP
jgi:hypothetical protein